MNIFSSIQRGYEGVLVEIETDFRRGIPEFDIIGLPDSAIREARVRVKSALRNSGYSFPRERVIVNLVPAGVKKEGSSLDLAIGLAVLAKNAGIKQVNTAVLVVGELELSGKIRGFDGVSGAVAAARINRIKAVIAPVDCSNIAKRMQGTGVTLFPVENIKQAVACLFAVHNNGIEAAQKMHIANKKTNIAYNLGYQSAQAVDQKLDYSDMAGMKQLKRVLQIAAAGRHHILLFGPPGIGKTMAAKRFQSILPELPLSMASEVLRIHSLSEKDYELNTAGGIIEPVVFAHYTDKRESLMGNGSGQLPGFVSLAHNGVLVLDEASEFQSSQISAIRGILERKKVEWMVKGSRFWFPADFQLFMIMNACPCGRLGQEEGKCLCSPMDVHKFWKRIGSPLLDRIDIRFPVVSYSEIHNDIDVHTPEISSEQLLKEVITARTMQKKRYHGKANQFNGNIPAGQIGNFITLNKELHKELRRYTVVKSLSARAIHGIKAMARTIADIDQSAEIEKKHLEEAFDLRRYGDGDFFWKSIY